MKFEKKLSIALVSVLAISVFLVGSARATDCWVSLPSTPVTMEIIRSDIISFFSTTLSDVPSGYDVTDGTYLGWCVDLRYPVPEPSPATHVVMLYSSCAPPADLAGERWDMVNYILNHKQGEMMDIQQAIWYFMKYPDGIPEAAWRPGYTPTPAATAIVDDAMANGAGFVPGLGEVVAVICYPEEETQITIIELLRLEHIKQFTDSGAFDDFTVPEISSLSSMVFELHSGPRIWWEITYYFKNEGEGNYFILWDKWGGNLMALDSPPVAFDNETNVVTLENDETFSIDPRLGVTEDGYKGYIHPYRNISDLASQGSAFITGHIGDQQQGTNPGKGKGSHPKGGNSYDADIRWEIGWLDKDAEAWLRIYIAPGKNPGGKLQFSSSGCYCINTGPRVRVYGDSGYEDFLYAIDETVQLCVHVDGAEE